MKIFLYGHVDLLLCGLLLLHLLVFWSGGGVYIYFYISCILALHVFYCIFKACCKAKKLREKR